VHSRSLPPLLRLLPPPSPLQEALRIPMFNVSPVLFSFSSINCSYSPTLISKGSTTNIPAQPLQTVVSASPRRLMSVSPYLRPRLKRPPNALIPQVPSLSKMSRLLLPLRSLATNALALPLETQLPPCPPPQVLSLVLAKVGPVSASSPFSPFPRRFLFIIVCILVFLPATSCATVAPD